MSATPWNIRGSASQLFYQDKECPQYEALLAISELPHPDRSILSSFIDDAANPREAAQYFLEVIRKESSSPEDGKAKMVHFLSQWITIIDKLRPTPATSLSDEVKSLVFDRDGGICCVTDTQYKSFSDPGVEYVYVIPPSAFYDPDLSEGTTPFEMLSVFMSETSLNNVREMLGSVPCEPSKRLDNIWLLSKKTAEAMRKGAVYFQIKSWAKDPDVTLGRTYSVKSTLLSTLGGGLKRLPRSISLQNRTPKRTPILNSDLLTFHAALSRASVWAKTKEVMNTKGNGINGPAKDFRASASPLVFSLLRSALKLIPQFIRSYTYDKLIPLGLRLYGAPFSMTVYRLPFGLYLRRSSTDLAEKYQVEAHTLRMIERHTSIIAPRPLDVFHTSKHSYLLMTRVPGRPIGPMLSTLTDEQLKQAVTDLKGYISQLRQIPRDGPEYRICSSKGGGILDWRIPDSQQEELMFKSEADFNRYLTQPFSDDVQKRAAVSHEKQHDIVFTHGDLNPRNILATEDGKITGIVDWENAGWFPEYWEYTKSHYAVRHTIRWLADVVDRVFEGYRDELFVENMLSDLLGPF